MVFEGVAAYWEYRLFGSPRVSCTQEQGGGPMDLNHTFEAAVKTAGVTLRAVATALGIDLRDGTVSAEGDLDFRGTLGVDKMAPVGFRQIRLSFDLDSDASQDQLASLMKLTERYCVVYQTLAKPAQISIQVV